LEQSARAWAEALVVRPSSSSRAAARLRAATASRRSLAWGERGGREDREGEGEGGEEGKGGPGVRAEGEMQELKGGGGERVRREGGEEVCPGGLSPVVWVCAVSWVGLRL
jgi:hypothetical protein